MASDEVKPGADPDELKTESKTPKLYEKGPQGGFIPVGAEARIAALSKKIQTGIGDVVYDMDSRDGYAMPAAAAADYVAMLGAVETVANDSQVLHKNSDKVKYKYPSQAAIQKAARVAMAAHGWAAEFSMWSISARSGLVEMDLWFRHKSGYRLHKGKAGMPMENNPLAGRDEQGNRILKVDSISLRATISILRKYMMGAAMNMGWSTPEDDAEQKQNLDFWQSQKNQTQQNQGNQPPPTTTQRTTTPEEPKVITYPHHPSQKDEYRALLDKTGAALKFMKAIGCMPHRAHLIATGRSIAGPKFPPNPLPCTCDAIIFLARACKSDFEEKPMPPDFDHEAYILNTGAALKDGEGDVMDVLFWHKGERTVIGIDRDKAFMKVKREPPKEPPKTETETRPETRPEPWAQVPEGEFVPPADDDIPF